MCLFVCVHNIISTYVSIYIYTACLHVCLYIMCVCVNHKKIKQTVRDQVLAKTNTSINFSCKKTGIPCLNM